jgi:peroxiredoxin
MQDTAAVRATTDWQGLYDGFVADLRARGAGARAPKLGEQFPDFALPDSTGRYRILSHLMAGAPIILSFQRGDWCPYCRGEVTEWAAALPQLRAAGVGFVAVTPQVGGQGERWRASAGLDAPMLADVDHGLAVALGLAVRLPDLVRRRYHEAGLDLAAAYGDDGGMVPIPAVFALDASRTVRFAYVEPDFRRRSTPAEAMASLTAGG